MENKDYSIGLDIGTNSVGYSVIDENYKVISKKIRVLGNTDQKYVRKNLMGSVLFDGAETAAERRLNRVAKRRYERRRNRILYLQEIFQDEVTKIDPNFFHRLQDSFHKEEDKRLSSYPIFGNLNEETAYHEEFPTIYDLRKRLADNPEKADIRLVYLAVAHILKYRGHFLIEGDIDVNHIDIQSQFAAFLEEYNLQFAASLSDRDEKAETLFKSQYSKSKKSEELLALFPTENNKGKLLPFLKLMVGNQVDFKSVFDLEEKTSLQFSKDNYEEDLENLIGKVGDDYLTLFELAKSVNDAMLLSGILSHKEKGTKAPLSASMVERYREHQEDLAALKKFFREHLSRNDYVEMFKDKTQKGYAAYIEGLYKQDKNGKLVPTSKAVSEEDFYKFTKSMIEKYPEAVPFLEKINQENFLRKQRTFDNGSIPHQVHLKELQAILRRQSKFYPFLAKSSKKIQQILTFRIPYYVGPLAQNTNQSNFAWLSRKSDEAIRPWNFEEIVDTEKSAADFIERMTVRDTYLPEEKVLPRHSLLYERFAIFNELTKVNFIPEGSSKRTYFSATEKKEIFDQLFKKYRTVKCQQLIDYIEKNWQMTVVDLQGIEEAFNANFTTYNDLKSLLGQEYLDDEENQETLEEMLYILTVFDDKKMILSQLTQLDTGLEPNILKKLARKKYTGWGRFSKKLIDGIHDKKTGRTILGYLIDDGYTNRNFMQLIHDEGLSFKECIEEAQNSSGDKSNRELVQELAGSPAIKKSILQSLEVIDEIVKVMKRKPKRIVLEMARDHQGTQKGRNNSKQRQQKILDGLKDFEVNVLNERPITDNKELQKEKIYLYYLQNGRDMYTGAELDFNRLSDYDVDHIVPQSFIKDDSFDNKVLTIARENRKKVDDVPDQSVVNAQIVFWRRLHKAGLMSDRKFANLTKGELTEKDKLGFINRQMVETRQIIKNVAQILDNKYNLKVRKGEAEASEMVKIVTLNANLVSRFRSTFGLYKIRELNHYHHAHDAYLNAVLAQALLRAYPQMEKELVYGSYVKVGLFDKKMSSTDRKWLYHNILKFMVHDKYVNKDTGEILWDKKEMIKTINRALYHSSVIVSKKREVQHGALYKASNMAVGYNNNLIPRKKNWDVEKYGGFIEPTETYSVAVFYKDTSKKKTKNKSVIIGIPLLEVSEFEKNPELYLQNRGFNQVTQIIKLPKYSLFQLENGRRRLLASSKELQKGNQFVLPKHLVSLLYHAKRLPLAVKGKDKDDYDVEKHRAEFGEILELVEQFDENYVLAKTTISKIRSLYEKHKDDDIEVVAESFVNLLTYTAMGASADFTFFGEKIGRKRYPSTNECFNATLIHQSITGLYETRIDLSKLGED